MYANNPEPKSDSTVTGLEAINNTLPPGRIGFINSDASRQTEVSMTSAGMARNGSAENDSRGEPAGRFAPIHISIEQQVLLRPNAVAVSCAGSSISALVTSVLP